MTVGRYSVFHVIIYFTCCWYARCRVSEVRGEAPGARPRDPERLAPVVDAARAGRTSCVYAALRGYLDQEVSCHCRGSSAGSTRQGTLDASAA